MKKLVSTLAFALFAITASIAKKTKEDPTALAASTTTEVPVKSDKKVYVWEVTSLYGKASGEAKSAIDAYRAIYFFKNGDVLQSKIVETIKKSKAE